MLQLLHLLTFCGCCTARRKALTRGFVVRPCWLWLVGANLVRSWPGPRPVRRPGGSRGPALLRAGRHRQSRRCQGAAGSCGWGPGRGCGHRSGIGLGGGCGLRYGPDRDAATGYGRDPTVQARLDNGSRGTSVRRRRVLQRQWRDREPGALLGTPPASPVRASNGRASSCCSLAHRAADRATGAHPSRPARRHREDRSSSRPLSPQPLRVPNERGAQHHHGITREM